jgi:hypothetical protein
VSNQCVPTGEEYCPDGDYCYTKMTGGCCTDDECGCGECVDRQCTVPECCGDDDCDAGETCVDGQCVIEVCLDRVDCVNVQQPTCPDLCPEGSFPGNNRALDGTCCTGNGTCCSNNCVNGVCVGGTPPPECENDSDCGACEFCDSGTCHGECSQSQECCTDQCVPLGQCGHLCLPESQPCADSQLECCPGLICCIDGQTSACAECCDDSDCAGCAVCNEAGQCADPECCTDTDCPDCEVCGGDGTCHPLLCLLGDTCCGGHECVPEDECCNDIGDECGLRVTTAFGGEHSHQLDCCDGLVCCENWSSQGRVCAQCCNDWDCGKGGVCVNGVCEYPTVCHHDHDCPEHTCCCDDGSCSWLCCEHHHHPHPHPKPPTPETTPATALPATGAGSNERSDSSSLGITLAAGAAALLGAKLLRQQTEEASDDA